jgi:hypothetical protein
MTKMSGCNSRKKKRELDKEEIRQCLEVFGEVVNRRYDSNRMPIFDNNSLTYNIHPKKQKNYYKIWYQVLPEKGPTLSENKVLNFNLKMLSILSQEAEG